MRGLRFVGGFDGVWADVVREVVDVKLLGEHAEVWRGKSL
jgi:hypothetical protein